MARRVVLVVDPDPATARKTSEALKGLALEVCRAASPDQIDALLNERVPVAVLSALTFEGSSGYELIRTLRGRWAQAGMFLFCGGFDVLDPVKAQAAGVDAAIRRPFSAGALRSHLEKVLGVLPLDDDVGSTAAQDTDTLEVRAPLLSNERVATFIPQDYDTLPPVAVDPEVVSVAMEQAILAALPETVEILLEKSLRESIIFKAVVERAVVRALKDQLPPIVRGVVRESLIDDTGSQSSGD